MHVFTYKYSYIHTYIYIYIYTYIFAYVYIVHIYIYIYFHIDAWIPGSSFQVCVRLVSFRQIQNLPIWAEIFTYLEDPGIGVLIYYIYIFTYLYIQYTYECIPQGHPKR